MCAATRRRHQWEPPVRTGARLWLPEELRAVLTLAPPIRRCFVLRSLAGMSAQACARLLGLLPNQVDEYAGAAHRCLATL
jgi:DNA-directed RNA polymerase specialized sigma24 family protein